MAANGPRKYRHYPIPGLAVTERVLHAASGAAGIHTDQTTKRDGQVRTNRVGSRRAARRAAMKDDQA